MSFYDRSYTGNAQVDITYAQSLDGGASWQSRRVTSKSFDPGQWGVPSSNAQGFRPFIGDYNGQYSTNSSVGIAWTGVSAPAIFSTTYRPDWYTTRGFHRSHRGGNSSNRGSAKPGPSRHNRSTTTNRWRLAVRSA